MEASKRKALTNAAKLTQSVPGLVLTYHFGVGVKVNHYFLIKSDHKIYDENIDEQIEVFITNFTITHPDCAIQITDDRSIVSQFPAQYHIEDGVITQII